MTTTITQHKNSKATAPKKAEVLGFRKIEASVVVSKLDTLLANFVVHYHKLRNFHWNVVGPDFFDIHEKLEAQYDYTKETIDVIAERIRVFGSHPTSTMAAYLEMSEIKENSNEYPSDAMIGEVLNDFEILLTHMTEVYDVAAEVGDIGTTHLIQQQVEALEKTYWMFSSFNK